MKKYLLIMGIVSFFVLTISLLMTSCKPIKEGMDGINNMINTGDLGNITKTLSKLQSLSDKPAEETTPDKYSQALQNDKSVSVPWGSGSGIVGSGPPNSTSFGINSTQTNTMPASVSASTAIAPVSSVPSSVASTLPSIPAPAPVAASPVTKPSNMTASTQESFVPCMDITKHNPIHYY